MLPQEPKYKHSGCRACVFLGRYRDADLYYCPQGGIPTTMARFSDEPSDYTSGLNESRMNEYHGTAAARAVKYLQFQLQQLLSP